MARVNLGRVVGRSAYEEAVRQGYVGNEQEWLASLHGADGDDGKTAYQGALDGGFVGTEAEFNTSLASIGYINDVLDAINEEVV